MEIKNINEIVNWSTIPKVIQNEYSKNGHLRSELLIRNDKGGFDVTYGEIMNPIYCHVRYNDYNFLINVKYEEHFLNLRNSGVLYDEDFNIISKESIKPFLVEYSKGFNKGYNEFETNLKNYIPFFGNTDEHLIYKIYSRIISDKKGSFPYYASGIKTDLEKKIRKEKKLKILLFLNKERFFENGFEGGEFYKAWEIILTNPTAFESIFKSNAKENKIGVPENKTDEATNEYISKPCFKPESIESITNVLNTFFDPLQHAELKRIIKTGSNTTEKLLFRDNGNRLTDYFKRLYESDIITGCNKKILNKWIIENFKYTYRKNQKEYLYKTVEKTISGTEQPCKNPII